MNSLNNRVQLIGNLGQDPEVINLDKGGQLVKFSLATHQHYTNKQGDQVEDTQWHRVVVFNKTAEIISNHVKKGDRIGLEGKLTTRSWEDAKGDKRYSTEVVCNQVMLLGAKA